VSEAPVIDASPLIYLARAERLDLLQILAPEIQVPLAVAKEVLLRGPGDAAARALADTSWLRQVDPGVPPARLIAWDLGPGETEVLAWALGHPGSLVLMDDLAGRRCAGVLGFECTGTLGLVLRAKKTGKVAAARPVVDRLRSAGMYLSDRVLNRALALVDE
jgi:predicted nucleic acid-binding protein